MNGPDRYEYVCDHGHAQGLFPTLAEAAAAEPDMNPCYCGAPARRHNLGPKPFINLGISILHEHYNISLGQPITTKRQLRDIQKRFADAGRPINDYEPVKERSPYWKEKGAATAAATQAAEDARTYERDKGLEPSDREYIEQNGSYVVPTDAEDTYVVPVG